MRALSQGRRALLAVFALAMAAGLIPLSEGVAQQVSTVVRVSGFLMRGEFALQDNLDEARRTYPQVTVFEDEALDLEVLSPVYVENEGFTIGFSLAGTEEDVFSELSDQLVDKGWAYEECGYVTGATFSKEEGNLRWMVITCTLVSDQVSVCIMCTD